MVLRWEFISFRRKWQ